MSAPLDIDAVVLINEALTGNLCSDERRQRLDGCLSSYSYYNTIRDQITSIVVSLLKDHFFQDGNKRTALAIYLDLCQHNGIKFLSDQDRLRDVFIDIAANQRDIVENTRLLFPD
ncbi:type II toxin-antitoxin system death-on-curing family toxin [Parasutterella excrementihominis]|uniref:type II toxin-antitoxin system death-on-curing family toxin n=1 Tax=Parasutterella excrementihominis TaxID=487175 RepID=UPI0024B83A85|nr:type II toxin-antitoxin system death-on-curing family toxin [Parasutterella excrementihominis]